MTAEREALEDIASVDRAFVEANGVDGAFEKIIARARQALANPATIRDTDEDAGDAAWLRQLFPVSNTYAKARDRCERIAARLASTPAEPREASGYCPFCMTADPVSRA